MHSRPSTFWDAAGSERRRRSDHAAPGRLKEAKLSFCARGAPELANETTPSCASEMGLLVVWS